MRLCGNSTQTTGAVVLVGPSQLFVRVHHERAVPRDRLADRLAAHDVHVECRRIAVLSAIGSDADRVAGPQHGELTGLNRAALGTDKAFAVEHVYERVEVAPPGKVDFGARLQGGVDYGDRGVSHARARVTIDLTRDHADQRTTVW